MALKNKFYTVNGQILGERAAGGALSRYLPDALGSVTGVSQSGSLSGAARYSSYGRTIAGSSGADLGWIGGPGYRPTGRMWASHYVRARTFDAMAGAWTVVDPLWPRQQPYGYAGQSPLHEPTRPACSR